MSFDKGFNLPFRTPRIAQKRSAFVSFWPFWNYLGHFNVLDGRVILELQRKDGITNRSRPNSEAQAPTCPSPSRMMFWNMWKIWLDGWWIVVNRVLLLLWVKLCRVAIMSNARAESRPVVGSWKQQLRIVRHDALQERPAKTRKFFAQRCSQAFITSEVLLSQMSMKTTFVGSPTRCMFFPFAKRNFRTRGPMGSEP